MSGKDEIPQVLLGVTGGIAAYKSAELASLLVKQGMAVRVVMTRAACSFITPLTLAALTGHAVACDMFDPKREAEISHIELARWAHVIVVAPATANIIAKAAVGLADDLLSTILLAADAPLLMAPAMNPQMYAHPTVQDNLGRLKSRGGFVIGPNAGRTACGEEGPGRMAEPREIAQALGQCLAPRDLAGVKIVVTAGPTREHMDPVRFISNPSTGLMGIEIARAAALRGASVSLVLGPTHLASPAGVKTLSVVSAQEMHDAVMREAEDARVVIGAAAVSDFRPVDCAPQKVKKNGLLSDSCQMEATTDIMAALGQDKKNRVLVGFAAETEDLLVNAQKKLKKKNLEIIVANDVSARDSGFAAKTNRVHLLTPDGQNEGLPLMSKQEVAGLILDRVAGLLVQKGG